MVTRYGPQSVASATWLNRNIGSVVRAASRQLKRIFNVGVFNTGVPTSCSVMDVAVSRVAEPRGEKRATSSATKFSSFALSNVARVDTRGGGGGGVEEEGVNLYSPRDTKDICILHRTASSERRQK